MPTLVEKIVLAREERDASEERFRKSLKDGRASGMSWSQLATASGLSLHGVRYLTLDLNDQRKERKGENNDGKAKRKATH